MNPQAAHPPQVANLRTVRALANVSGTVSRRRLPLALARPGTSRMIAAADGSRAGGPRTQADRQDVAIWQDESRDADRTSGRQHCP
jgi:hypothetical protein